MPSAMNHAYAILYTLQKNDSREFFPFVQVCCQTTHGQPHHRRSISGTNTTYRDKTEKKKKKEQVIYNRAASSCRLHRPQCHNRSSQHLLRRRAERRQILIALSSPVASMDYNTFKKPSDSPTALKTTKRWTAHELPKIIKEDPHIRGPKNTRYVTPGLERSEAQPLRSSACSASTAVGSKYDEQGANELY